MKKDIVRDYATAAFRLFAACGKPCEFDVRKTAKKFFDEEKEIEPIVQDLKAVCAMMAALDRAGKGYICLAVEAVYFVAPKKKLRKSEITERVRRFAFEFPADEATVYRWLREARTVFAQYRGIRAKEK